MRSSTPHVPDRTRVRTDMTCARRSSEPRRDERSSAAFIVSSDRVPRRYCSKVECHKIRCINIKWHKSNSFSCYHD